MPKKYVANGIRCECVTTPDGVMLDFVLDIPNVPYELKTLYLLKNLRNKGHVTFCDRLYTSINVFRSSLDIGQHMCGTAKTNRGFPKCLSAEELTLEVGEWKALCNGTVVAFAWMDSGHCQLLSTFHIQEDGYVLRRVRGISGRQRRPTATAFVDYNVGMGGNDCGDMLRSRISCHLTTAKWWKAVFFYCIDQAVIASYRIWNQLKGQAVGVTEFLTMREIQERLILALGYGRDGDIPKRTLAPRKRFRSSQPVELSAEFHHYPVRSQRKDVECVRCRLQKKRRRTKIVCSFCEHHLCLDCFAPFHSQ